MVELAVWDEARRPKDEDGKIVDLGVSIKALLRDIPAILKARDERRRA